MTIQSNIFPFLPSSSLLLSPLYTYNKPIRVFVDNYSLLEISIRKHTIIGFIKQLKQALVASVTILFGMCASKASLIVHAFNGTILSSNPMVLNFSKMICNNYYNAHTFNIIKNKHYFK